MNQLIRKKAGRISRSLLIAAMAAAVTGSGTALAEETKNIDNTFMETSCLTDPVAPKDSTSAWSGSYVYFGNYGEGENKEPIKFRVLAKKTEVFGGNTLFLDSDKVLFDDYFDKSNGSNVWADSDIKKTLNGSFLTSAFSEREQDAIASSKIASHALVKGEAAGNVSEWTKDTFVNTTALTGEKVFLLDIEDASNIKYGYNTSDENSYNRKKECKYGWFLRNARTESTTRSGYIGKYYGVIDTHDSDDIGGIAPALNVIRNMVIFTTNISGKPGEPGAEYKLTLADLNLQISVPKGKAVTASGKKITVPYQISGDNAETATRVSVVIVNNSDYSMIYYDALEGSFSNNSASEGTFTLPDSLDISAWGKDYYVYILAEDINGTKETDYAGAPIAIDAPQVKASSIVTYSIVNGTWADGTTADKTEIVDCGMSPAAIPSGMIASNGFANGSWNTDPASVILNGDTTFTYKFEAIPVYTVTFNANGHGTAPNEIMLYSGKKAVRPAMDNVEGWTFDGWYTDAECKTAYDFSKPVTDNIELFAKWTEFIPTATPTTEATPAATAAPTAEATPAATVSATPTVSPLDTEAKIGDVIKDPASKNSYKITSDDPKDLTVSFTAAQKNAATVNVPATVKISGKKYKVTEIKANAFKKNKKLTRITIGKNIKKIGKNAFLGCKNLNTITVKTSLLTKKSVGKDAFKGINAKAVAKVPKKKLKAYKPILQTAGMNGKKQKITK